MGLMAVEEQQRHRQMMAVAPPKKGLSKRFVVTSIIILLVLNLGVIGWFYFKIKASAESATTSSENATTFSSLTTAKLPDEDVAGQDLAGLEKYKGAVRTFYEKDLNSIILEYKINASPSLILNFYKSELTSQNWILQNSKTDYVLFVKEKAKIEILTLENKTDKITTFKIIFTPSQ
ncbi:hypothetical protein A2V71_01630 [Candidatus Berkelbacteria bacterium RBG_13_40_8]|uniref:Uncharacterized protein n=1 Tax=Candidatus Berkelbacteria bacterium RBG_13_40_8 TaxID=1797467 RepID=A0A1F5DPZ7_9BACT|nr:MAG: hypothetical protein A2V71_01630 [Candidatus Berkelbacteria bacterium RBG_13_40_8]